MTNQPRISRNRHRRPSTIAALLLVPLFTALAFTSPALAQDEDVPVDEHSGAETEAHDQLLLEGADVYARTCSACHQAGGAGVSGQFPPLIDNPSVQDTLYMEDVIANGLEGELEVAGVSYNGRMPAFSILSDGEVDALITYVQSGFAVPQVAVAPTTESSGSGLTSGVAYIVYVVIVGVALLALSPRIVAVGDRMSMPWLDASAKSAVIVIWFVLFTVFVPSWVMQSGTVSRWDRNYQDLIGVSLWGAGLLGGLVALWWAQRQKRI